MGKLKKFLVVVCIINLVVCFINLNMLTRASATAQFEITGRVLKPDGTAFNPSKNSYVTVVVTIKSSKIIEYETDVNEDGSFILSVDDGYPEDYTIVAYARGTENPYASSAIVSKKKYDNSYNNLTLMMPVVEGKILDPEGNELDDYTGIKVIALTYYSAVSSECMVNEDGSYKIGTNLKNPSFFVKASIDYKKNSNIEFAEGQELVRIGNSWGSVTYQDIKLSEKLTVQGRLYYHDGKPFNPAKHDRVEIFLEPIGTNNKEVSYTARVDNARNNYEKVSYTAKVDNDGFYTIGGNIAEGSTFVIKGYSYKLIDTVNFMSCDYEYIVPSIITTSSDIVQNMDLFFGSPTYDVKMNSSLQILDEGTYSFGKKIEYILSKNLKGDGNVNFVVDDSIECTFGKNSVITGINFSSYPNSASAILKCSNSGDLVFKNCEFSESLSVITNIDESTQRGAQFSFENCKISNIYGDVFFLNKNDKVLLKNCTITNCANLTNIPDAITYEGDNKINNIMPEESGALICGSIFNQDGYAYLPENSYSQYISLIFENINTNLIYKIPAYYGRYSIAQGIPDGRYKISYVRDDIYWNCIDSYTKGIDTGFFINVDSNKSCVQDIVIHPKNLKLDIGFVNSEGECLEFENIYTSKILKLYNEINEYINSYVFFGDRKEYQLDEGNYKGQIELYIENKMVGSSEVFDISVGKEYNTVCDIVELKPRISKMTFKENGWIENTENGHYYKTSSILYDKPKEAEEEAIELGGHLVTINNQEENDWLESIWGSLYEQYWIGYKGKNQWISNENSSYANWFEERVVKTHIYHDVDEHYVFNVLSDTHSWEGNRAGKWCFYDSQNYRCYSGIIELDKSAVELTPIPTQTLVPTPTPTTLPTIVGDVNFDQSFDSIDFAFMRQYLLGIINDFPALDDLYTADVNSDNNINAIDFAYMRRYLLGVINVFPKELD